MEVEVEAAHRPRSHHITATLLLPVEVVVDGTAAPLEVGLDRTAVGLLLRPVIPCTVALADLRLNHTTNIIPIPTRDITTHALMDTLTEDLLRPIITAPALDILRLLRCIVAAVLPHHTWTVTAVPVGIQDHVDRRLRPRT